MDFRRHRLAARAASALAVVCALVPAPASAAPFLAFPRPAAVQTVAVEVLQSSPSVAPDGALRANIAVTIAAPAEYLEVRLRLRGTSGALLYQKTEVRANLPAGRHVVGYDYDIGKLDLAQGRYPMEIRVLATGAQPTTVTDRLLVVDPGADAVPVALVVRLSGMPSVGMDGRLARDPAADTELRDDIAFLTQLAIDRRQPLALAIPPVLIEQLARTSGGYQTTAGVRVTADAEVPARYARALDGLRAAVASGTVDLVDVPFALPDLAGLAGAGLENDLAAHWSRTDAVLASTLRSATASSTAYIGERLTLDGLSTLAARRAAAAIAPPTAIRTADETAAPGCYAIEGAATRVIVWDDSVASGLVSGPAAFYDALFEHLGNPECTVVVLEVGPGTAHDATDAQRALDWIAGVPWLRVSPLAGAVEDVTAPATLAAATSSAPATLWPTIADARGAADAYATATGLEDAETRAVTDATLVAESALWAGPDDTWPGAAGAAAYAESAADFVAAQFEKVIVDAKDVTLSGRRGNVPFTLVNGTGKTLNLTIVATADDLRVREGRIALVAQPDENFVTIPVDLQAIIADELRVEVVSGTKTVAETTVTVRASYLDRLATLGTVVIVLLGLLFFIRRRVKSAIVGTIPGNGGHND